MKYYQAAEKLEHGKSVYREGWDDPEKFVTLEGAHTDAYHGTNITGPYMYFLEADGTKVPYTPDSSDIMATDWQVWGEPEVEKPVKPKVKPAQKPKAKDEPKVKDAPKPAEEPKLKYMPQGPTVPAKSVDKPIYPAHYPHN